MKPTAEQTACVDAFQTGEKLRINAYAGTGKTSTLTLLAKASKRSGTYVAFNKAIATEAASKFPATVACSTTHSLAFRSIVRRGYTPEKMTGSVNGGYTAVKLDLKTQKFGGVTLRPRAWGWIVSETVKRWQRSGSADIQPYHVPLEGKLETLAEAPRKSLRSCAVKDATRLWEMQINKRSDMPLGHDGYLKLWALDRPQLPGDYILLDEAQDTGGVVLDLMRHQAAQLICVGDKYQSLYEWRGAKNAMVELPATVERRLTTSFRFGPAIADYASQILALMGETAPLLGNPDRDSVVGPVAPQALLCRTNIRLIERLFDCLAADEKPAVVGGVDEILSYITAAEQLMAGKAVDRPIDFFGFADWNEVEATAQSEPGAEELRKWTSLFKKYKTDVLRKALSHLPRESAADVVLSTGHKSKGREWDTVRLEPDFLRGMPAGDDNEGWRKFELEALSGRGLDHVAAELRLFYVAATRGQTGLEVNKKLISKMERLQKIANCKVAPAEVAA